MQIGRRAQLVQGESAEREAARSDFYCATSHLGSMKRYQGSFHSLERMPSC